MLNPAFNDEGLRHSYWCASGQVIPITGCLAMASFLSNESVGGYLSQMSLSLSVVSRHTHAGPVCVAVMVGLTAMQSVQLFERRHTAEGGVHRGIAVFYTTRSRSNSDGLRGAGLMAARYLKEATLVGAGLASYRCEASGRSISEVIRLLQVFDVLPPLRHGVHYCDLGACR